MSELDWSLATWALVELAWMVWAAAITFAIVSAQPHWRRPAPTVEQPPKLEHHEAPLVVAASTFIIPDAAWIADVNRAIGGPAPFCYFNQHLGRHRDGHVPHERDEVCLTVEIPAVEHPTEVYRGSRR